MPFDCYWKPFLIGIVVRTENTSVRLDPVPLTYSLLLLVERSVFLALTPVRPLAFPGGYHLVALADDMLNSRGRFDEWPEATLLILDWWSTDPQKPSSAFARWHSRRLPSCCLGRRHVEFSGPINKWPEARSRM